MQSDRLQNQHKRSTVGCQGCFEKPKHVPTPATSPILHLPPPNHIKKKLRYPWRTRQVRENRFVPRAVCAESKSPGMRAPQPRVARDPRNIRPQTRVDTISRETFKCCHSTATIYLQDQDCRGHDKSVIVGPSCRVFQK